jgi:small subunit ribosomal protein S9
MGTVSGRRKEAPAVVKLTKGTGIVTVNKKSIDEYFGRDVAKMIVRQPLVLTKNDGSFDVDAKVQGGGSFGQAGAIRLAISKALLEENPELRADLKKAGYLTRDSRVKERKKVGLKKARKSPQFSKRSFSILNTHK